MNLGVFNRVNLKDNTEGKGMYSEWASLSPLIQNGCQESHSVLDKFGIGTGKDVALGVVKQLASNLGITQAAEPSPLITDREVQWCMEVICFGLTLPLSEHDTIKDCVNVYCEWLSALLPVTKICVPKPVCEDPNLYARKIISHFHNLFVPRKGEGLDIINRQAVLCHRVLRTLQQLAHESVLLNRETWEALLLFLLAINDTLLSPPTVRDDVADQLCERVLSVLFEVWLIACARCFPSPPLWKTLRESCMNWRHRIALIEQWNRINLALTARVLEFMYGPTFPELKIGEEDLIPAGMSNDCIAQSWFRFLHCLGNPVNLCRPEVISKTDKFLQFAISSDADPCQHTCLQSLPLIFLKAIKGIAGQVDAFLGIAQTYSWDEVVAGGGDKGGNKETGGGGGAHTHSPTPPPQRRLAKSFSVAPSTVSKGIPKASLIGLTSSRVTSIQPSSISSSGPSSNSSLTSMASLNFECRTPLAQGRPKCNSILHLFGEWLFEAAFVGTENTFRKRLDSDANKRPNSIIVENPRGSLSISQPGSLSESAELPATLTIDKYESGKAEAIGALCRVFCAKKTGEEILPVYLARFYLALQHGLKISQNRECGETLVSILLNSSDLFRLDLDGVQILIPSVISALEIVLPEKDLKLKSVVSKIELRRASIHLLLSMLVVPLHFQNLVIRELGNVERNITFAQLKPRLMNLLMNALQVESDPQNTHMLLGGLLLCVQDSSVLELVEQVAQPDNNAETTSNLLSSVSDTASMASAATGHSGSGATTASQMQDFHSLPDEIAHGISDIQALQSSTPVDSAHALFVRATYLVCHRLISTWKSDLNVSLAALELLSGLARIQIRESDALECKRAVKWVCDYIVSQCSRPPPAHSKDLHSTIVAAFQCCAVWLLEHPYLLQDKDCLNTVLEVVELGVSGTKSVGKPGEKIRLKDDKELKPASMRVRDAAENLLTCILEQVGYFPSECGAESLSSLLDEVSLLRHCNTWPADCTDRQVAVERFRYFVAEGSILLALLEEPLGNDQDPQPTVTLLIRGPFGRHAWTMQLRHLPRHRSGTKYHAPNPGRPVPMQETPLRQDIRHKYFPDSVDKVPLCKVDQSIPTLETVTLLDTTVADETAKLSQLLERQAVSEANVNATHCTNQDNISECSAPNICHEYQTARLFLSHFGFLTSDNQLENSSSLIALDSSASDFCRDLMELDAMSARTCDTVHVFYVRAEQRTAQEIVTNVWHESTVTPQFLDFLLTLGWPVDVATHPGWTGNTNTSWRVTTPSSVNTLVDHGGCLFDGQSQVLYWADATVEVAFVVPSQIRKPENIVTSDPLSFTNNYSHTSWYVANENSKEKPRTLSLDLDKNPMSGAPTGSGAGSGAGPGNLQSGSSTRRSGARHLPHPQSNTKILVVWLESYEDHLEFPTADVLAYTMTGLEAAPPRPGDCFIIFLQWLNSGLVRVHVQGPSGRMNLATPLVDGMIVSRRTLGPLVRQTAINMSRRKRLDNDTYQPPHVRRRLKVQEIVQKYKRQMSEPELLTYLFSSP